MHGPSSEEFLSGISGFLGSYYLALAAMNGVAAFYLWQTGRSTQLCKIGPLAITTATLWLFVSILFTIIAPLAMSGDATIIVAVSVPQAIRNQLDAAMDPKIYMIGTFVALSVVYLFRKIFVKPTVAWGLFNLSLLIMGLSMTDSDFAAIVTKADNVPIVAMVFLLGFFTWLSASKAVTNDERIKQGLEPTEKLDNEKVLVWPDLVYTELICMIAITALLLLWAIGLQAPLEEPASAVKTPNPSKAPWYFLGLQEMLVYYDPWMAGVVLPSLVIFGLMAIPFIDFNPNGNGYYTIEQRKFAYTIFQFGFLVLWVTLIVMGTFLRGPNWNFFGLYETWDPHKVEALNNVDLSELIWIDMLGQARPRAPNGSDTPTTLFYVIKRELPGIFLLISYLVVVPPALVIYLKSFRNMYRQMGFLRYMVLANLLMFMALLPIKMVMRWAINLKYFIAIPEFFFNF